MTDTAFAVDAQHLTKSYGRDRGIVDVGLQVLAGEVVGLVGANGAGKTTFMRTLLDFIRPTGGRLSIFGLDSVRNSVEVRRRTAYLPGELVIPPRLRGHDAVRRFTTARTSIDPARVRALAARLDLDLTRRVGDLSKGNKQKVGLVLAFAPPVDLLVLDEPTSGLDPLLQREFAALVHEAVTDGATVILSSHVMSEVEQIATRVALMRDGRIAAVDDISAIRARSRRRGRARPVDAADLAQVAAALTRSAGVAEVAVDGDAVTFACAGQMDDVLKTLAGFTIAALDVTHTDLEDAFFSAYDEPANTVTVQS
jgi:ABC-2 type transport system ATP-binding protein